MDTPMTLLSLVLWLSLGVSRGVADSVQDVQTQCSRLQKCSGERTSNTLHFGLFLSFPDPFHRQSLATSFDDGHDLAPAVYLAVDQINNRSDLLQDYTIKISRFDGGCYSQTRTTVGINKLYCSCDRIVGIIGPACEKSSQMVSMVTNHADFSMITINYGGQRESVGDYPYAFGILGRNNLYASMINELIKLNNWTNTALLYYGSENFYNKSGRELIKLINSSGYQFRYQSAIYDYYIPLTEVKESHSKVIVVLTTMERRLEVLCLAYYEEMIFPHYQWIFNEIFSPKGNVSFNLGGKHYNCSEEEMIKASHGTVYPFLTALEIGPNSDSPTSTGYTAAEYYEAYMQQAEVYSKEFGVASNTTGNNWANALYDASWVLAFALNATLAELDSNITDIPLGSKILSEALQTHLLTTSINGTTGSIRFDPKGYNKEGTLSIYQYTVYGESDLIAYYGGGSLNLVSNGSKNFINDSFKKHYITIHIEVAVGMFVITALTSLLTMIAQFVNIYYRNHKIIKASSPPFNHVIFIGSYMILLGVAFYVLESLVYSLSIAKELLCTLVPSLFSIGTTILLGTVCIKTWRLNRIFTVSRRLGRARDVKHIRTPYLVGFVTILVATDLGVCILWRTVDPLLPRRSEIVDIIDNETTIIISEVCTSKYSVVWLVILLVPKVLLTLASFISAISTKFKRKEFSTNNVIILSYLLTIIFGLGIPLYTISFLADMDLSIRVALLSTCLNTSVCVCTLVLLSPFIHSIVINILPMTS